MLLKINTNKEGNQMGFHPIFFPSVSTCPKWGSLPVLQYNNVSNYLTINTLEIMKSW